VADALVLGAALAALAATAAGRLALAGFCLTTITYVAMPASTPIATGTTTRRILFPRGAIVAKSGPGGTVVACLRRDIGITGGGPEGADEGSQLVWAGGGPVCGPISCRIAYSTGTCMWA
jgi:hypothetical protein